MVPLTNTYLVDPQMDLDERRTRCHLRSSLRQAGRRCSAFKSEHLVKSISFPKYPTEAPVDRDSVLSDGFERGEDPAAIQRAACKARGGDQAGVGRCRTSPKLPLLQRLWDLLRHALPLHVSVSYYCVLGATEISPNVSSTMSLGLPSTGFSMAVDFPPDILRCVKSF